MASFPNSILIVTPFDIAAIGGVSNAVKMLMQEFKAAGHSVHILVGGSNKALNHQLVEGRSVYTLYLRMPQHQGDGVFGFLKFMVHMPFTLWQLALLCRRENIGAIFIQYPLPHFVYFGLLRHISRWKLVLTFQGCDAHSVSTWRGLNRRCLQALLGSADHISGVAQSLLQKVTVAFPSIATPTSVIPNGSTVITNSSPADSESPLPRSFVFSAGHLVHRKGFDVLIRAFSKVQDQVPSLHLLIAGDGVERDALTELVRDCNVEDSVHLIGWRDHGQTLELMDKCLFFALTSRAEGLPLVIAEAMMKGKTVLATAVDGVPDIVDHKITGILVQPEDLDAVATGICELTLDTELRSRMEHSAKIFATRAFNWKSIAGQYLRVGGLSVPPQ